MMNYGPIEHGVYFGDKSFTQVFEICKEAHDDTRFDNFKELVERYKKNHGHWPNDAQTLLSWCRE
jgi:hypothetical protein